MRRMLPHSLLLRVSHSLLARHSLATLLAPVVVASGVAGFLSGQVVRHLPPGLSLTQPAAHQTSGQVQGALGRHIGGTVANQPVVRTVYVPNPAPNANAHQREGGSQGKGGKGDKHGKGDHGDHGDHGGHGKGGHGDGHVHGHGNISSDGGAAGGHAAPGDGGSSHLAGPPHHGHG